MPRTLRSDLGPRLASALVLIPAALLATMAGGAVFAAMLAVVGCLVALEWSRMVAADGGRGLFALLGLTAVLTAAAGWLEGAGAQILVLAGAFLTAAVASDLMGAVARPWAVAGVAYVGLPLVAMSLLRFSVEHGVAAIMWLFVLVWAGDAAAFVAGRAIGGPRLAPVVSPGKTWAGAVAGLAAATAVGWIAALAIGNTSPELLAAFSLALGAAAVAGDLFESAVKRRFGVKDSGGLIPGHGGAMDRVDSLIAASLVAAVVGGLRGGVAGSADGAILW